MNDRWTSAGARRRMLITTFLCYHLLAVLVWNAPWSYVKSTLVPYCQPYMHLTGLTQWWAMFAPHPGTWNIYLEVRITYADGTELVWPIGRQDELPWRTRWVNARNRKLVEATWDPTKAGQVYPQMARWAARVNIADPANPPVTVAILQRWSPIPPLPGGLRRHPIGAWQSRVIYSTTLGPSANP